MLFNSLHFLLFFPIVVILYYLIPDKLKNYWLLLTSYYFYMSWNPRCGLLLLGCTLITYGASLFISAEKYLSYRKKIFILAVTVIFLLLGWFKYTNMLLDMAGDMMKLLGFSGEIRHPDIILPVGISFFTFQSAGYLVDVYRKEIPAEKNFFKYALFVSFFPQLVAGPIERSGNLSKQLETPKRFDYDNFREGILLMIWGFFLKLVIADRAAFFVDSVYVPENAVSGSAVIIATILFSFQLYTDFFGYSTIAMGAAQILGIRLTDNFNAPYYSRSIAELWRRWHVSMSTWFRDYLYIPLGGNRKGTLRKYVNLMFVFLVSGLWHGASWSFAAWGCINGAYQVVGGCLMGVRRKLASMLGIREDAFSTALYKTAATHALYTFSLIFFRSQGLQNAFSYLRYIVTDMNWSAVAGGRLYQYGLDEKNFRLLVFAIILLMTADYLKYRGICIRKKILMQDYWFRGLVYVVSITFIIIFGIWGNAYSAQSFIYFQF